MIHTGHSGSGGSGSISTCVNFFFNGAAFEFHRSSTESNRIRSNRVLSFKVMNIFLASIACLAMTGDITFTEKFNMARFQCVISVSIGGLRGNCIKRVGKTSTVFIALTEARESSKLFS